MWAPEVENMELDLPVIEKIDDPEKLLAEITECLQQKDTRSLKTYILEHKTKEESIFWELILRIGQCINAETSERHAEFFDVCCRCLMYLVKVGNPKECLLALLEQVDTFIDDVKFKNFLPPIQTALLNIPTKLFHSLDITLETVSSHLRSLELPENTQLEGEEVKIFHADKIVIRLADILYVYLKFLEPFVNAVVVHLEMTDAAKQEAVVLKKHLIRLFEHPLCHLVLTYDPTSDKAKSDSRLCAELAISLLSKVETDLHKLMKHARMKSSSECTIKKPNDDMQTEGKKGLGQEECENEENEIKLASLNAPKDAVTDIVDAWDFQMEVVPLAKACLAYLVHVEHLGLSKYPAVYTYGYLLDFYLETISVLLKNTNYPVNYKGLLLLNVLTQLVPKNTIAIDYLDNPNYLTVINDLIHIMVKCPVRDHRTMATTIFPVFISRFVAAGRFQIYQSILISCDHSGLKGYLITLLKNDINDNLRIALSQNASEKDGESENKNINSTVCEPFMGKRLEKLLKLALILPEKETTDMLEHSDQIISSLNLLRFLILADSPESNITGFWSILPDIETEFLSPLRRGLDLSRAHYVLDLDTMKAGQKSGRKGAEVDFSIEGMTLPLMEEREKVELLGKAVNTHDVMLSLVARVSELVDQQRRLTK